MAVAIWVNLALLCYDAVDMAWRNDGVAIGVAAVAASVFMTWIHQASVRVTRHPAMPRTWSSPQPPESRPIGGQDPEQADFIAIVPGSPAGRANG